MDFTGRDVVSIKDLSVDEINHILDISEKMLVLGRGVVIMKSRRIVSNYGNNGRL